MKALIVFELVPEDVTLYVIDQPDKEEQTILYAAAGQYLNSTANTEAVDQVDEWIASGRVTKLDSKHYAEGPFDTVVVCGLLL